MARFTSENNPGKGRPKGKKNVRTELKQMKLEEGLATNGVQISEQLALAILAKDIDLIKALATVLPYLTPRLAASEQVQFETQTDDTPQNEADLLKLIPGN